MNANLISFSPQIEVYHWLSDRQFVKPHDRIRDILADLRVVAPFGVTPPEAIDGIDFSHPIGRLSRAQLEKLAADLIPKSL